MIARLHHPVDWLPVAKGTLSPSLSLAAGGMATCHPYADWSEIAMAVCHPYADWPEVAVAACHPYADE